MDTEEEHNHEHDYVEIVESETISAYAEAIHEVVTLQLNQRGIALNLSYEEALELTKTMEAVQNHIAADQKSSESRP